MNRFAIGLYVTGLLLITSGCIEKSVVIKVNRDGSGIVHVRDFEQSTSLGLSFGGSDKAKKEKESKPDLPSDSELAKVAQELGKGVTVQSVSEAKNDAGWNGFEVIFAFERVADLTIGKADMLMSLEEKESKAKPQPNESDKMKKDLNVANSIRFELKDGVLVVHQALPDDHKSSEAESATKDPFASEPKTTQGSGITSSLMEGFLINALKDARIGMFIELEGGIGGTNAIYHDKSQVTLIKAALGPMIQQKAKLEEMSSLSNNLSGEELRKALQDLVKTIDGMDIDMSETVTIAFKSGVDG